MLIIKKTYLYLNMSNKQKHEKMENLEFLKSLLFELKSPTINKRLIISEIDKQEEGEFLRGIKFQLQSVLFLKEYCINEVEKQIQKVK